jgi:hypothetical protein
VQRGAFIEQILISTYGGLITDETEMTIEMINAVLLPQAIGVAAQACYKGAVQMDGVGYVNNSFYTTFSGIAITTDDTDNLCYKLTLPEVPVGIGKNEGVSALRFKDGNGFVSLTAIPLSMNQQAYADSMKPIPNKILYWPEGDTLRMKTTLPMWSYTAVVKMISGGDSSDLNSTLNVPSDFHPFMVEYIQKQLLLMRGQPADTASDGLDKA